MPTITIETNDLFDLTKELRSFLSKGFYIEGLKLIDKTYKVTFKKSQLEEPLSNEEQQQLIEQKLLHLKLNNAGSDLNKR